MIQLTWKWRIQMLSRIMLSISCILLVGRWKALAGGCIVRAFHQPSRPSGQSRQVGCRGSWAAYFGPSGSLVSSTWGTWVFGFLTYFFVAPQYPCVFMSEWCDELERCCFVCISRRILTIVYKIIYIFEGLLTVHSHEKKYVTDLSCCKIVIFSRNWKAFWWAFTRDNWLVQQR